MKTRDDRHSVLVTGANGFVGRTVCERLLGAEMSVTAVVRAATRPVPPGVRVVALGPIESAHWAHVLPGHRTVVHLSARVHHPDEDPSKAEQAYHLANVVGTTRLADAAVAAGVERIVFVSTIKVCGESTGARPFDGDSPPAPQGPYAASKAEAERVLRTTCAASSTNFTILRPPLVHGPGVRANFGRLLQSIRLGIPLPLASVRNRRSLVHVVNLADLVLRCTLDPRAAGRTYAAGDGTTLSTPELVRRLAAALGRPARLLPCPPALLRGIGAMLGRATAVERLIGSLEVNAAAAMRELDWYPPLDPDRALADTATSGAAAPV